LVKQFLKSVKSDVSQMTWKGSMRRSACLEAARQFLLLKLEHALCGGIACGKGGLSEKNYTQGG